MTQQVIKLTEADVDRIWNAMPSGAEGFMKQWGYQQFADAIMDAQMHLVGEHIMAQALGLSSQTEVPR